MQIVFNFNVFITGAVMSKANVLHVFSFVLKLSVIINRIH